MKITVLGATGGTGRCLVSLACEQGHDVTAVVRSPARFDGCGDRLDVVLADVTNPDELVPAVEGRDAVISALGARSTRKPTSVCTDGAASAIGALQRAGGRRLVVVSNSGMHVDAHDELAGRLFKPVLQRFLKHPYADMRRMEEVVRSSDLDWTIVQPPRLVDGPRTGRYRTAIDHNVRGGNTVTRADLADLVLRCAVEGTAVGAAITIGS